MSLVWAGLSQPFSSPALAFPSHLTPAKQQGREAGVQAEGFLLSASCPVLCVVLSFIHWSQQGSEEEEEEDGVVSAPERQARPQSSCDC